MIKNIVMLLSRLTGISPKKITSGMLDEAEYVLLKDICEKLANGENIERSTHGSQRSSN